VLLPADTPKLAIDVVSEERLVVVLPRGHRLAARSRIPLAALAEEDIVWMSRRSEPQILEVYIRLCHGEGFSPRIAYEVDHLQSMFGLVSAGLGVSHAPASIRDVAPSGVVCRALERPVIAAGIGMVHNPDNRSPTLAAFLALTNKTRATNKPQGSPLSVPSSAR
jgi:DNA-binding transcriptional LysR family regulator